MQIPLSDLDGPIGQCPPSALLTGLLDVSRYVAIKVFSLCQVIPDACKSAIEGFWR